MKRMIVSSMRDDFNRIADAKEALHKYPQDVIDYVKECRDKIVDRISQSYYTEEEDAPVGPAVSEIKRDYMTGAIEDDMMTEEEFEEIFDLLDVLALEHAHKYA